MQGSRAVFTTSAGHEGCLWTLDVQNQFEVDVDQPPIGEGSYGVVRLARDKRTGKVRVVAFAFAIE